MTQCWQRYTGAGVDEMRRAKAAMEEAISAQLALAYMYVAIAESADDPARRQRNAVHARRVLSGLRAHLAQHAEAQAYARERAAMERLESRLGACANRDE